MTSAIIADSSVTGNLNAELPVEISEAVEAVIEIEEAVMVEEETLKEETLEEEIIEDLITIVEITEMEVTDSVEEVDPDLALQQAITEVHQESTMTSEDHQEEIDLDLVAEMDLLTVENGTEMITEITDFLAVQSEGA